MPKLDTRSMVFRLLQQTADGLVKTFGPNCEVAIHDISELKHALIYLAGNVTRREPGAPISDSVVKALIKEGNRVKDRYGHKTILEDGRELKSTTLFIRDNNDEVMAAFCINFDTTDYVNAIRALEVLGKFNDTGPGSALTEKIAFSVNDTVDHLFEQAVADIGKQPATMTPDEKVQLVGILEQKGAFQIKGVVGQVAIRLGVTNFTVYNYLKKIRAAEAVGISDDI